MTSSCCALPRLPSHIHPPVATGPPRARARPSPSPVRSLPAISRARQFVDASVSAVVHGDGPVHDHAASEAQTRPKEARDAIVSRVEHLAADRRRPLLVAIDGGSGSGKSILGSMVAEALDAALIRSDDFYSAHVSVAEWDRRSPREKVAAVIDWQRLREEVLEPLLRGEPAQWHAFDFNGVRPDDTYPLESEPTSCDPAAVIVLEGAYSSRPELADLVDLSVLVDSPVEVRHQRLEPREDPEFLRSWHARWDAAEEYYFSEVRPKSSFDLVVTN